MPSGQPSPPRNSLAEASVCSFRDVLVVISLGLAHHYLAGDSSDFCIYILGAYLRLAHSDHGTFRIVIVIHTVMTHSHVQTLGYQRTLQVTDLWRLNESYTSAVLSKKFNESWTSRKRKADAWNAKLAEGFIQPSLVRRFFWLVLSILRGRNYAEHCNMLEKHWRDYHGKQEASIALSLNDTLGYFFWIGGLSKVRSQHIFRRQEGS
jgi:hypothetical protein